MSMTNHPITSSSQMLKSHDCRARDIKRRLDVIQKKMTDLQELGVPCAFCYVSRNTGSLFTSGTEGMTKIIEKSRDAILDNLSEPALTQSGEGQSDIPCSDKRVIRMVLPLLPQPLADLSLHELRSSIVGIIKDLGIKWSDNKPPFWPAAIPFQYPQTAPDGFQGCLTVSLREIVRSMYNYFDYNPDTYCKPPQSQTTPVMTNTPRIITEQMFPFSQNRFFPERIVTSPNEKKTDDDLDEDSNDEEGEEIDVGVSYTAVQTPQDTAAHLTVPPPSSMVEHSLSNEEDNDDDETVSICSNSSREPQPMINYFGYEIAQSDSSPHTTNSHYQSDQDISPRPLTSTPSPRMHPIIQPQQLLYCSPQLYSQLYPVTMPQTTPFLIQPNLQLLKNRLVYTTSPEDTKTNERTKDNSKNPPLTIPYTLPRPLQLSSLNLQPNPASLPTTLSYPLLSTANNINHAKEEHITLHDTIKASPPSPPTPTATPLHQQQEPFKNRKGRNHGIYIYTTPSEPLKFMSLSSKKNNKRQGNDKKLVAMAPVPPPMGMNSEAVISLKDSNYRVRQHQTKSLASENAVFPSAHNQVNSILQKKSHSSTISSKGTPNSRKPNGTMKRRRELVFHWYQSPENQPGTSPPSTKRINTTAGTV